MQENTHIDEWTWMEDPDKIIIAAPMIANWHTCTKYHNKYCQGTWISTWEKISLLPIMSMPNKEGTLT